MSKRRSTSEAAKGLLSAALQNHFNEKMKLLCIAEVFRLGKMAVRTLHVIADRFFRSHEGPGRAKNLLRRENIAVGHFGVSENVAQLATLLCVAVLIGIHV